MTSCEFGEKQLPANYTYMEVESGSYRIKEVTDKESAMIWLAEYSKVSKTTWRVARTFPHCGKVKSFKKSFRCHHNTRPKQVEPSKRESKHTGCPAKLELVVQRSVKHSKSKIPSGWPSLVKFSEEHNHSLTSSDVTKFRDLSDESRQKLLDLFRQGHKPSSALQYFKKDLLEEHGDNYCRIEVDGYYVPTISVVEKMYATEFRNGSILFDLNTSSDYLLTPTKSNKSRKSFNASLSSVAQTLLMESFKTSEDEQDETMQSIATSTEDELSQFHDLLERMKNAVTSSPFVFVPAMQKMIYNASKYATTEIGLASAMQTFALFNGIEPAALRRYRNGRQRGTKKGVQPAAAGRRKLTPSGIRAPARRTPKSNQGPHIKDHDYTTFGTLPSRKRKAPLDLNVCSNVDLNVCSNVDLNVCSNVDLDDSKQ